MMQQTSLKVIHDENFNACARITDCRQLLSPLATRHTEIPKRRTNLIPGPGARGGQIMDRPATRAHAKLRKKATSPSFT
jgi:hypothetical protein